MGSVERCRVERLPVALGDPLHCVELPQRQDLAAADQALKEGVPGTDSDAWDDMVVSIQL